MAKPNRPIQVIIRTLINAAIVTLLAALAASSVTAQTLPRGERKAEPDLFDTPLNKTAPAKRTKSCDQYGEGFVYVPASDSCVRFGGTVRYETGRSGR